jgi:alanine dehydrogenase
MKKSYGFPKMNKEVNEKRSFLPTFFGELVGQDIDLFLGKGYGEEMGYTEADYLSENSQIRFESNEMVYGKDVVTVLRAPSEAELKSMKRGAVLISMLHYVTRERRNTLMEELGIITFSMDSMVDDDHRRVVVNNYGTAYNGAQMALEQLECGLKDRVLDRPLNVAIIGLGEIGLTCARAFKDLSNERLKSIQPAYEGIKLSMLTRSITSSEKWLIDELSQCDILVDASSRTDTSKHIISNALLEGLPEHAVILDITADPYDFEKVPAQVKAIEGIPTGTLDQIVFKINDLVYTEMEQHICVKDKRTVVSCNAWPGVDPVASKLVYGRQLLPILKVLIKKGADQLNLESKDYYERILVRSSYGYHKIKT